MRSNSYLSSSSFPRPPSRLRDGVLNRRESMGAIRQIEWIPACAGMTEGMVTRIFMFGLLLFILLFSSSPSWAQLVGDDNTPGTSCDKKGAIQMTANATGPGAYILTCDGNAPSGKWVATLNTATPTANAQVANKQYVDTAVAASGGGIGLLCVYADMCVTPFTYTGMQNIGGTGSMPNQKICCTTAATDVATDTCTTTTIGDTCPQGGMKYAGMSGGRRLYTTATDQAATAYWGSYGTLLGVTTATDGLLNTDAVSNYLAANPKTGSCDGSYNPPACTNAHQLCRSLRNTLGGSWYLPSHNELLVLFNNGAAIGGFSSSYYWSSTEYDNSYAYTRQYPGGSLTWNTKSSGIRVRCVRQ